jgi:hypothetical protein
MKNPLQEERAERSVRAILGFIGCPVLVEGK